MGKNELSHTQLIGLISMNAVQTVDLVADAPDRFCIRVNGTAKLMSQRSGVRYFKSTETALRYLRDLGIGRVQIDMQNWVPPRRALGVVGMLSTGNIYGR